MSSVSRRTCRVTAKTSPPSLALRCGRTSATAVSSMWKACRMRVSMSTMSVHSPYTS
ncbi:hypothetical protein [Streptomyces canus]|uniref:hypothetical protein n=1 Tax=Streptomyces canus TaxID=58343 RepID=UPI002E28084B|nr:hypothetical protein [Streptomyces canus]